MAYPSLISSALISDHASPGALTAYDVTATPPSGANSLLTLDTAYNSGGDCPAGHQYYGTNMTTHGGGTASSYAPVQGWTMLDVSGRSSDTHRHWAQWAPHAVYAYWFDQIDAVLDFQSRYGTWWSYENVTLTVNGGGTDGLAVITASIDETSVARIYTPPTSTGTNTPSLVFSRTSRGVHRVWQAQVPASDGAVTFTVQVSGQLDYRVYLFEGASAATTRRHRVFLFG